MSKRIPFSQSDLEHPDESIEQQERVFRVFNSLKLLAVDDKFMTESEKDFFCNRIKSISPIEGILSDYPCCENFVYKQLYLTYGWDLTGGSRYTRVYGSKLEVVPLAEREPDLKELISIASDWEKEIFKENHSEKLLQAMSKEARESLKLLNSLPEFNLENNPFSRGSRLYRYKRLNIILFSKFTYIMAKEVFECTPKSDFQFSLRDKVIEMDELSLIHILQRHYGEGVKNFRGGKSHFYGEFKPRELNIRFQDIVNRINKSDIIFPIDIFKIPFLFNKLPYMIWISEKHKQVKGVSGNVKFLHLSSFHPITDQILLKSLESNYELNVIDNELSLYVKNN